MTIDEQQQLRELQDRSEIQRAVITWARNVDRGDPEKALEYFSEDCVVDYGPGSPRGPMKGREEYLAFMREAMVPGAVTNDSLNPVRSRVRNHHVGNILITFPSSDTAEVEWYSIGMIEDDSGSKTMGWSIFNDQFRRTEDGWRTVARQRRSVATQPL